MFVGLVVVQDQVQVEMLRDLTVETLEETEKLLVALPAHALRDHRALQHVQRSEQRRRPVALVVVGHRSRAAALERQARLGPVQSLDLALLVHAQHKRVLGRIPVQATTSRSFSTNLGSLLSLNVLTRWGFSPCATQMRWTAAGLMPWARAIERTLQWV